MTRLWLKIPWRRPAHSAFGALLVALALFWSSGVAAEAVQTDYLGKTLNAQLKWAPDSNSRAVVMLVHDTADYLGSPLIRSLQDALAEAGINSLAITLSRGMDNRQGPLRCSNLTESSHEQGIEEVGAWFDWLQRRDIGPVSFFGHGRGGNQVAWFLAESEHPHFDRQVLLAPMTWDRDRIADEYARRHGTSLHDVYREAQEIVQSQGGSARLRGVGFLHCDEASVAAADFLEYYYDERRFHTPELLGESRVPTLVLLGEGDDGAPGLATAMSALDNPRVEYRTLPDADYRRGAVEGLVEALASFLTPME